MRRLSKRIRAVAFDYGNTLVEFSTRQIAFCDEALALALERIFGRVDRARLRAVRDRNRMAAFLGEPPAYRENDIEQISADLVRQLYGVDPTSCELIEIMRARYEAFLSIVEGSDEVRGLLHRLGARYPLALVSNYPEGTAIRASLDKVGYAPYFDVVVVSGDLGYAKPHPMPFDAALRQLDMSPREVLFVGDNWLADVQGAKWVGMYVAHVTQWPPYEPIYPQPGDEEPDLVLARVADLEAHV